MGFARRLLLPVKLILFSLLVSSCTSRSLKSMKHEVFVPRNFQYDQANWIKELGNSGGSLKMEGLLERRMNIELADYPDPGANTGHDPTPPGRV